MLYENYLKPRRILMTADTLGGVWTFSLELARVLAEDGIQVALATMGEPLSASQWADVRAIPDLEVYESRYKLEWMEHPWKDVMEAGVWLLQLEERFRPDIIHLNGYAHAGLPWRSPKLIAAHSCVLSWWEAVCGEKAPPDRNRYFREVARGLLAADIVVAPSIAMFWDLCRIYGPIRCGRVIYNGRDPNRFRPLEKADIILTAGRLWDRAKNLSLINRIASRLPWPVYAAGPLSDRANQCVPTEAIRPLGALPEIQLAEWFGCSSIFLSPVKYEPFGLSILEAALCECALVLGDIPSQREIWADSARYVDPDDPDGLVEAACELITHPERRRAMGESARKRALSFTSRSMTEGYKAVYRELAEGWHRDADLFQPQTGPFPFHQTIREERQTDTRI